MRRSFSTIESPPEVDAGSDDLLRTSFTFELPRGYVDGSGTVHRVGSMRLATARDELVPLADDRVRENPAYLTVRAARPRRRAAGLGDRCPPGIIENLFAADLAFLQDLYRRVNQEGHAPCGGHLPVVPAGVHGRSDRWSPGGIVTYGEQALWDELAVVGANYHWSLADVLDLEHATRVRFVRAARELGLGR